MAYKTVGGKKLWIKRWSGDKKYWRLIKVTINWRQHRVTETWQRRDDKNGKDKGKGGKDKGGKDKGGQANPMTRTAIAVLKRPGTK